jgi:hypothetical protein
MKMENLKPDNLEPKKEVISEAHKERLNLAKHARRILLATGVAMSALFPNKSEAQVTHKKNETQKPKIENTQEKLPPYITYDPEDIRIQLYKDSLRLHEQGDSLWKSFGKPSRYGIDVPKLSKEELSERSMSYAIEHNPMAAGYFRDNKKDKYRPHSSRIYFYYNAPKQEVVYDKNYPKESIYDYRKRYESEIRAPYSYFSDYYVSEKFKERLSLAGMQYSNDLAAHIHTIINEYPPHIVFMQNNGNVTSFPDSVDKDNYFPKEYTVDNTFIFDVKDNNTSPIPNDVYASNCIAHKIMSRNKEFAKGFNEKNLKQELEFETNSLEYISKFKNYDENTMHIGPVGFEKSRREQREKVRSIEQILKHIQPSTIQELIDKNVEIANKYQKGDPYDFIADINTLRYELYRMQLYNSKTENFSMEILKNISKNPTIKILLNKLLKSADSKKDLVKAMNEII